MIDKGKYKIDVRPPPIVALLLIISCASIGAVLYTPALHVMGLYFHVPTSTIQYSVTIYVLGYCVAQLIYGPLVNRFGRKPVLIYGLSVAIICSLLCGLAKPLDSLTLLMIARFFAALAAGCGLVIALTMISDVFFEHQAARIVPIIALSFSVVPGVSISIGGFITHYIGWEWCFYFLTMYYFVILMVSLALEETKPKGMVKRISVKSVINGYLTMLKDSRLVCYSAVVGLSTVFIYIYAGEAPVVAVKYLNLSPDKYGMVSLIPFIGYAIGNILTSAINRTIPFKNSMLFSYIFILTVCVILVAIYFANYLTLWSLYIPLTLMFVAIPCIWSNGSVLATAKTTDKANANSTLSFLNTFGAVTGLLLINATSWLPAPASMVLLCLITSVALVALGATCAKRHND